MNSKIFLCKTDSISGIEFWPEHRLYKISGLKMSVLRIVIRTYNRIGFLLGVFTFSLDSHYEKGSFELVRNAFSTCNFNKIL